MTTNFLGIPVHGDITRGEDRKEQRPIEELQPILQAVLDDPTIVEFGWRQATPYFNDGEPCTFSVHGTWVRTTAGEDADEEGPDEDRYRRCKALEEAVEGGHFEHVLLDAFGDHAEITVSRDGIQIEFYSHD